MEHADVANVAVVAIPDKKSGKVPLAFIELRGTRTLGSVAIRDWCQTRMAYFKVPPALSKCW